MKQTLTAILAFILFFSVNAQVNTPQKSPFSKVEQKVGLTDVTLEYSRPSARGRIIFGNLVPYGKVWRAGANKNTTISFSDDVVIENTTLKAGTYAIYITPSKNSWDIIFYSDANNWGNPRHWDEAKVAVRATVKTHSLPMKVETWTITFDNLSTNSAELGFIWENTYAGVSFNVPTDKKVSNSITKTLAGPTANDYYAAAVYNLSENKDLNQAKLWMDKAMSMIKEARYWQLRQQSLLYAKLGDKKNAIATAKKSLEGAKAAKNADYVKMNMDSIKAWETKN